MRDVLTRRDWLSAVASTAAGSAASPPAGRVSVAHCTTYDWKLVATLDRMFDQLGGLARIVSGKTVAIKVNLTSVPWFRVGHHPAGETYWTHPSVIGATIHIMDRAGARRVRVLESHWNSDEPLEEWMLAAGWEPRDILNAAARVEFENTNSLGRGREYRRLRTPKGGHIFKAFDLNHSYEDCDVFVSIAKLKEHSTAGVMLSMKNCFGITPCTIYGDGAGVEAPGERPRGGRGALHKGTRQPSKPALPENDPSSPREDSYRVPRIVADLVAARPIDLAIIDGIHTMTAGEVYARASVAVAPGVLVAGTNCVNTDAVATAIMGFDPMADRDAVPFERCDSTLRLAKELGSRDLRQIDVVGAPIKAVRFDFRSHRAPTRRRG